MTDTLKDATEAIIRAEMDAGVLMGLVENLVLELQAANSQ